MTCGPQVHIYHSTGCFGLLLLAVFWLIVVCSLVLFWGYLAVFVVLAVVSCLVGYWLTAGLIGLVRWAGRG